MTMNALSSRCLFGLAAASLLAAPLYAQDLVSAGAGSYTTKLPAGAKEPAETPFITPNVKGPVPTNDWWSSLVFQKFSNQMFPHPLGIQAHTDGLRIYYPGTGYTANKEGVFTAIMGAPNDITIGHSANAKFPDARVDSWSDWFVTACFGDASATSTANLKLTFGHGSPFVYGRIRGGNPTFTFANAVTAVPVAGHPGAVTIQIADRTYGLYAPAGAKWEGAGTKVLSASSSNDYFSVALLPDRKPETIARFAAVAHNHVIDSKVVWQYNEAKSVVTSRYAITTKPMQGTGTKTLYCLLPHQALRSKDTLTGQTYRTSRGEIQLAEGNGFTTTTPFQGVLPVIPDVGIPEPARLSRYVNDEAATYKFDIADTYWTGKALGKLATLSAIADATNNKPAQKQALDKTKALLEDYFTAAGTPKGLFYYNKPWGTLIGYPASFGSDEALNDHHFHYGYFIRAAAEVLRQDPQWGSKAKWGPMVELLIRDCANPSRTDSMFPFLRNFDVYEGHTWADGKGDFADGNNNESSSEAMNAWTGLILWGELTGNNAIRDAGIYLYVTEKDAIDSYWFGIHKNYPDAFTPQYASMVWGAKAVYATWFSGDPIHMHGINILPLQSGSLYLGTHGAAIKPFVDVLERERIAFDKKDTKRDQSLPPRIGKQLGGWADVIQMYQVLADPAGAFAASDFDKQEVEAGNSRANYYQWMQTMSKLGRVDAGITADIPTYAVFKNDGKQTYIAFNGGAKARVVRFSDGTSFSVAPRMTKVHTR